MQEWCRGEEHDLQNATPRVSGARGGGRTERRARSSRPRPGKPGPQSLLLRTISSALPPPPDACGVLQGAQPPSRLVSTPSSGPPLARLGIPAAFRSAAGSPNSSGVVRSVKIMRSFFWAGRGRFEPPSRWRTNGMSCRAGAGRRRQLWPGPPAPMIAVAGGRFRAFP